MKQRTSLFHSILFFYSFVYSAASALFSRPQVYFQRQYLFIRHPLFSDNRTFPNPESSPERFNSMKDRRIRMKPTKAKKRKFG